MTELKRHPYSAAWPDMSADEFQALCDSIEDSGLREPILIFENEVLDGWHRYAACLRQDMLARFEDFDGTHEEAQTLVRDKHTRRSLTLAQRMTAILSMNACARRGRPTGNKDVPGTSLTSQGLADLTGASKETAQRVKAAFTTGSKELVEAMKQGKVEAKKAAAIARLPQAEQAAAIHKPLPKPVKPVKAEEPAEPPPPDYTELDAARDQIAELQSELVVSRMDGTDEDKQQASALIADLRAEVAKLHAVLKATELSRDSLIEERAQMLRQLKAQRSELTRLKAA